MHRTASRRHTFSLAVTVTALVLSLPLDVQAQSRSGREEVIPRAAAKPDAPDKRWSRLFLADPIKATLLGRALDEAARRLKQASCRNLVDEFEDPKGRPLGDRLALVNGDLQAYLRLVVFTDDLGSRACSAGALAVTMPGSRVVQVCRGPFLEESWRQNPTHVVATIIHELLHTLGLGENPPSSSFITERVLRQCKEAQERREPLWTISPVSSGRPMRKGEGTLQFFRTPVIVGLPARQGW